MSAKTQLTVHYTAPSLAAIAEAFELKAKDADSLMSSAKYAEECVLSGKIYAWKAAAEILRSTTLVRQCEELSEAASQIQSMLEDMRADGSTLADSFKAICQLAGVAVAAPQVVP